MKIPRKPASGPTVPAPRAIARYGWRKDQPDFRDRPSSLKVQRVTKLPASVDLSKRPAMPGVYDQGQLGSCTANAIAAAFEYDLRDQGMTDFMPARLAIYYGERQIEHTVKTDAGAEIRDGMKVIAKTGAGPESLCPYLISQFAVAPSAAYYAAAAKNQCSVYEKVAQTGEAIKSVLAAGRPIVFGITVYASFESAAVANTGTVPMPKKTEAVEGGHAILITGYTKTRMLFRNSWGTSWGKKGYGSLPLAYVLNPNLASDFWTLSTVS